MNGIRTFVTAIAAGVLALGLAAPATAVTPPFPPNWACEAPPAGAAWQVWHCKVSVRVAASRKPDRPMWANNLARGKAQAQATAIGLASVDVGIAGCRFHRVNKWNCTVLVNTPYTP